MTMTISALGGAILMGYLVAALFFFRLWRRARDRLFALFGSAFLLLALNQVIVSFGNIQREESSWVYIIRLAAFLLIILAILLKNLETPRLGKDS
jgi:O-antigen/teichoic acid export membrane protein